MADANIQKVVIPYDRLPYSTSDGFYYVRYRIISEDGTNTSSWSSKFKIEAQSISEIVGSSYAPNYKAISDGKTITLTWSVSDKLKLSTFDMYAKWSVDNSSWTDWTYISTTQANSGSVAIPTGKAYVQFLVQAPTKTKEVVGTTAKLFDTASLKISTLTSVDAGGPA